MLLTFKTIKYSYTDSGRADLAVVFPQAMQNSSDSISLISLLNQVANVIFIESGYYGITKIDSSKQASHYSITTFRVNLYELLGKYKYKKLYLVAGSVGGIHALSLLEAYPQKITLVALAGPALYRDQGSIINSIYKLLLLVGITFYPDKYFNIVGKFLKINPKTHWFQTTYQNVTTKIGSLSYLLCLKEIVEFTTNKHLNLESLLSEKVHIFLGRKDDPFNLLCDENLCFKAKSCEWVESDHSALNGAKEQIFKLLSSSKKVDTHTPLTCGVALNQHLSNSQHFL